MVDKKPEVYDLTVSSNAGISFKLESSYKQNGQLIVQVTAGNNKINIPLKTLTIMVRALNEAKNQHYNGSDDPS